MSTDWLNVADVTPRIAYTATAAGQTAFTVPFVFFEVDDLKVYQNGDLLTYPTAYSVTGAEVASGGRVTLTTGATLADVIMIVRDVPIVQTTHIPPTGPFDIPALNFEFSRHIAIDQQLHDQQGRSLQLRAGDVTGSGAYDAENQRIINLGYPSGTGDAAPRSYVDGLISAAIAGVYPNGVAGTDAFARIIGLGIARSDIPSLVIVVRSFVVAGDTTIGDVGSGATYVRGNSGGARAIQDAAGTWFNLVLTDGVKVGWYGIKPNGTDYTTALATAMADVISVGTTLIFPPGNFTGRIHVEDKFTFNIKGSRRYDPGFGNQGGTMLIAPDNTAPALVITSNVASSYVGTCAIEDMTLLSSPAVTGTAALIQNALYVNLKNVTFLGTLEIAQGTGHLNGDNIRCLGTPALYIWADGTYSTNPGPLTFTGGLIAVSPDFTNVGDAPALRIDCDPLGCVFIGTMFQGAGATFTAELNGASWYANPTGTVDFIGCHSEDSYSTANNGADFAVGRTRKFGHVGFFGGNFWGYGDGTHYRLDWLRIYAARDVCVDGATPSNLGQTGYTRSAIRLESGYPSASDTYSFRPVLADAPIYSDANGIVTTSDGSPVVFPRKLPYIITSAPVTLTGTSGAVGESAAVIVNASGDFVLELPSPASGRTVKIKSIAAHNVNSASSNVVLLIGGSAGSAILQATAGKWAELESDGTNWIVMAAN